MITKFPTHLDRMRKCVLLMIVFSFSEKLSSAEIFSCDVVPGHEVGEEIKVVISSKMDVEKSSIETLLACINKDSQRLPNLGEVHANFVLKETKSSKFITIISRKKSYFIIVSGMKPAAKKGTFHYNDDPPKMFPIGLKEFNILSRLASNPKRHAKSETME
jgi:hypothetical protein